MPPTPDAARLGLAEAVVRSGSRIGHDPFQKALEVTQQALHPIPIKQIRVVLQPHIKSSSVLGYTQKMSNLAVTLSMPTEPTSNPCIWGA